MGHVEEALAAADACVSEESQLAVEERCVETFRNGDRFEQLVAAHVLDSRDSISPATRAALYSLVSTVPKDSPQRSDLVWLVSRFDGSGRHIDIGDEP
jgi:hypothetical protein